jgi:SAM-dependent methyltransferase
MKNKSKKGIDYSDPQVQRNILIRQRREMWTLEQTASFAKHFRLKPGMRLLDAGCGYGYSLRAYGSYCLPGGVLVGIDMEKGLLRTARDLAKEEGLARRSIFHQGDIYDLPFSSKTFDVTIAQIVLCHLNEPEQALDELIRVTKRGGCIAIFDNASGGSWTSWDNVRKPTMKTRLFDHEVYLRMKRGRKRQGNGDWSIGCYVPSWMEQRGLRDVNARTNERVYWIAPPYSSPNQETALRNTKEVHADHRPNSAAIRRNSKQAAQTLRAGGADDRMIRRTMRSGTRVFNQARKTLDDGTLAFAYTAPFWCIWGFKP